jgi:hypothetical protein
VRHVAKMGGGMHTDFLVKMSDYKSEKGIGGLY